MAREQIASVYFFQVKSRKRSNEFGDASAGRVDFDWNRDGVAVVLDEIDNRELEIARRVERLPELAFARSAVACRAEDNFVFLKAVGDAERLRSDDRLG